MTRLVLVPCFLAALCCAQIREEALKSLIAPVRYPPIGRAAQVQGDVHLKVNSGVITIISDHPLLARTAMESAQEIAKIQTGMNFDLTYRFSLEDAIIVQTSKTVKRGDPLDRALLRVLGLKTEKTVESRCQQGIAPANSVTIDGDAIEVRIYGRTPCVTVEYSY